MIKKNRIFKKFFIAMFLAIIFFSLVFSIFYIKNQKNEILKSLELESKNVASMIIYVSSDAIVLNNNSFIVEFNQGFIRQNQLLKSIVLNRKDKDYYIIKKDSWDFKNTINKQLKDEEKNALSTKIMLNPILKEKVFHYTQPIVISGIKWGYLHLSFTLDKYKNKINSMYYSFISFFLIFLFITFLISYFIARGLSKPIEELNDIANEISHGNLEKRSTYVSNDEIGELSQSFNIMISKIHSSQQELKLSYEKLEERVEERTLELFETNKELENKTLQLVELNKGLDEKVKKEVEKRTSQEKLFIHQSRLAAIGELITNIAHQWRQPLSIITTAASGIKVEKEFGISTTESEIEKLDSIEKYSNYLSNTIENLDKFFKTSEIAIDFSIEKKLNEALDLISSSLTFYKIGITKNIQKEVIINGLANEYSQVIMNILSNAKDVLVQREIIAPKISIKIFLEKNYAFLEIEDNAGGIKDSIIDKIFDPYFTTKHQSQGVGIGLYMSKIIIEKNMKGQLLVKNTKEGAKFTIKVPIKQK